MVSNIFGMEPSRTLNSSEAIARGTSIYAALDKKLIKPMDYNIAYTNLVNIGVAWNSIKEGGSIFGEEQSSYSKKQPLFTAGTNVPF